MNKSTVIATCLVNSSMIRTLEEAEATVRSIFIEERPMADFSKWNCDVNDKTAENSRKQQKTSFHQLGAQAGSMSPSSSPILTTD